MSEADAWEQRERYLEIKLINTSGTYCLKAPLREMGIIERALRQKIDLGNRNFLLFSFCPKLYVNDDFGSAKKGSAVESLRYLSFFKVLCTDSSSGTDPYTDVTGEDEKLKNFLVQSEYCTVIVHADAPEPEGMPAEYIKNKPLSDLIENRFCALLEGISPLKSPSGSKAEA